MATNPLSDQLKGTQDPSTSAFPLTFPERTAITDADRLAGIQETLESGITRSGAGSLSPLTDDAVSEVRALLAEFGLEELAPWVIQLQLDGITDPAQLIANLEFTAGFQSRFPGYRDPETGEVIMSIPERLSFERDISSAFAAFGHPPPSRELFGALALSRRSPSEVREELQAIDYLDRHPTARRDFFAFTGVDPSGADLLALFYGEAPELDQAYQRAVDQGITNEEFMTRRHTFEQQQRDTELAATGVEGTIGELNVQLGSISQQLSPIQSEIDTLMRRLGERTSSGSFVVSGPSRAALWDRVRALKTQRNQLTTRRSDIQTSLSEAETELSALTQRQAELSTALSSLLASPPDLTPDFTPSLGIARNELLHNLIRARQTEESRFRSGGGRRVKTEGLSPLTL